MSHVEIDHLQLKRFQFEHEKLAYLQEKIRENNAISRGSAETNTEIDDSVFKPMVIVGPSGVGKGTLMKYITLQHKDLFGFSVSFTTRQPR